MYIAPDTKIYILKNVPLDNTYDHTIYFEDASSQFQWFERKAKYKLEKQSYQRVQKGVIRVGVRAESLYDCNYVMFQNSAFGTKWFYAFIKGIEYVNNNVSEITFELDVIQSWLINTDWELEICFVEREHTYTDEIGSNIVPENLEIGDEVIANAIKVFDMNEMGIAIIAGPHENDEVHGQLVNNVYTPMQAVAVVPARPATISDMDFFVNEYVSKGEEDKIIAIYQYPYWITQALSQSSGVAKESFNMPINEESIAGYKPKNKKLFTHPFNFILVSNNNGDTAIYKYEDWHKQDRGNFEIVGVSVTTPSVMVYPINYREIEKDYDSGLVLSNFPECAWIGDTFKAWWAQNKTSYVTGLISSVIGARVGMEVAGAGSPSGTVNAVGAFTSIAQQLAKLQDIKNTPSQVHGQAQTPSLNAGMGRVQYTFYNMCIKPEFAEIVDDYFTRYGYACHKSKLPNVNARPHWTFTKTRGCTIKGSIPCDDMNAICRIFDNGITWWKNGDEIGNYNLDNSPA